MKKELTSAEIKRINQLAEQLLPILYNIHPEDEAAFDDAKLVLAEFMRLLGYSLDGDIILPKK